MATPLRRARVRKLLTQQMLAELAGVSLDTVKRAERGVQVSDLTEERLSQALRKRRETLFPEQEAVS